MRNTDFVDVSSFSETTSFLRRLTSSNMTCIVLPGSTAVTYR
ncbi:MAG: hypothetical protein R3F14_10955 [Polyangiaceae bacterium]